MGNKKKKKIAQMAKVKLDVRSSSSPFHNILALWYIMKTKAWISCRLLLGNCFGLIYRDDGGRSLF
jgi:hypothetical protein